MKRLPYKNVYRNRYRDKALQYWSCSTLLFCQRKTATGDHEGIFSFLDPLALRPAFSNGLLFSFFTQSYLVVMDYYMQNVE